MPPLILTRGKAPSVIAPKRPWVVNRDSPQFHRSVGFYSFISQTQGAIDLSGKGNNGSFAGTGTPVWSPSISGKWGLEFTGTQRIELPNAVGDALEIAGTVAFMYDNVGTAVNGFILDTRSGGGDGVFIFPKSDNTLDFVVDTGGAAIITVSTSPGFRIGVARYTGANIFLDTDETSISTAQTGLATRTTTPRLGNRDNFAGPLGAGRPLVHVAVYDYSWPDALVAQFLGSKRYDLYHELGRVLYFFAPAVGGVAIRRYRLPLMGVG